MVDTCCNKTLVPYHIPGYAGDVPGTRFESGNTFSKGTHELLVKNVLNNAPKGPRPGVWPDPCRVSPLSIGLTVQHLRAP